MTSFRATFGLTRSMGGWEEGERRERNKRNRQPGRTGAGQRGEWQLNEQLEEINVDVEEREGIIDIEEREKERERGSNLRRQRLASPTARVLVAQTTKRISFVTSFRATFGLTRSIGGWEEGERRERNKRKRQPGRTGAGQRGEWQLNEQREEINVDVEEREKERERGSNLRRQRLASPTAQVLVAQTTKRIGFVTSFRATFGLSSLARFL